VGYKAIRRSRDNAWKTIETRRHKLLKVYTDGPEAEDLLIIGQVTVGLKDGIAKRGEFVARIALTDGHTSNPKIKLYKVWMVSSNQLQVEEYRLISTSSAGSFWNDTDRTRKMIDNNLADYLRRFRKGREGRNWVVLLPSFETF
jgi:hypothetical protein